jgi:fructose-1,6-bisphosphatase
MSSTYTAIIPPKEQNMQETPDEIEAQTLQTLQLMTGYTALQSLKEQTWEMLRTLSGKDTRGKERRALTRVYDYIDSEILRLKVWASALIEDELRSEK